MRRAKRWLHLASHARPSRLQAFLLQLEANDRSPHMIGQYRRHEAALGAWLGETRAPANGREADPRRPWPGFSPPTPPRTPAVAARRRRSRSTRCAPRSAASRSTCTTPGWSRRIRCGYFGELGVRRRPESSARRRAEATARRARESDGRRGGARPDARRPAVRHRHSAGARSRWPLSFLRRNIALAVRLQGGYLRRVQHPSAGNHRAS